MMLGKVTTTIDLGSIFAGIAALVAAVAGVRAHATAKETKKQVSDRNGGSLRSVVVGLGSRLDRVESIQSVQGEQLDSIDEGIAGLIATGILHERRSRGDRP